MNNLDQVGNRYLVKSPPTSKLDQVGLRYLVKSSYSTRIDQVTNRYLIKDNRPSYLSYTQTHHEYMMNALKGETYLPVKERYITFTHPEVVEGNSTWNSTIRCNVTRESGFQGYKTLYYNRLPIATLMGEHDLYNDFKPSPEELVSTRSVLQALNDRFGTKVALEDIEDHEIQEGDEVVLTASNVSYFFIPLTELNLGYFHNADRYWDLVEGTFTIPGSTQSRMRSTSEDESRYTLELSGHYSERRI